MQRFKRISALFGKLLLVVMLWPANATAQTVDSCMNAPQAEALTLCKLIIDNGSRNSDVFWKLSSAQFQEGQQEHANRTLNDALRLHPNNAKLLALKDIISSATTEQERIARSTDINQRSLDRGTLKILCLTKSGNEAISACKRRLEMTDDDGARMRARLIELEGEQKPSVAAIAPEPETLPEPPDAIAEEISPIASTEKSTSVTRTTIQTSISDTEIDSEAKIDSDTQIDEDTQSDSFPSAAEARAIERRLLVASVQKMLNQLGFPAGVADGIQGKQTRRALSDFYGKLNIEENTYISDLTLEELQLEQRKLVNAEKLLRQSTDALNTGNRTLAQQRLSEARENSKLVKVPTQLERALSDQQVAISPLPADTTARPNPITTAQPDSNQPTTVTNSADSQSQQFDDLMERIKMLYGKIKRIETDQASRTEQVRNSF